MKVELINKDEVSKFYEQWGKFSCICYDTDMKYAEKVGKSCHKTRHYSGSRSFYFIFSVDECDRATADQVFRHEQGVVKNMKSQRYTDSKGLGWYTPDIIKKYEHLENAWNKGFETNSNEYEYIVNELGKLEGMTGEKAREVARGRIAMNTHTSFTIGFTIEALEHFMHKRLCFRSQEAIRKLANKMKKEIIDVLPEIKEYMVPECGSLGYCNENKMQCDQLKNTYLTRDEFKELMTTGEFKQLIKRVKNEDAE